MVARTPTVSSEMILRLIRAQVTDIDAEHALSDDANLWQAGMDSLSSVAVVVAVEEEYDVEFPDELLTREVFSSAATISAAVRSLVD